MRPRPRCARCANRWARSVKLKRAVRESCSLELDSSAILHFSLTHAAALCLCRLFSRAGLSFLDDDEGEEEERVYGEEESGLYGFDDADTTPVPNADVNEDGFIVLENFEGDDADADADAQAAKRIRLLVLLHARQALEGFDPDEIAELSYAVLLTYAKQSNNKLRKSRASGSAAAAAPASSAAAEDQPPHVNIVELGELEPLKEQWTAKAPPKHDLGPACVFVSKLDANTVSPTL